MRKEILDQIKELLSIVDTKIIDTEIAIEGLFRIESELEKEKNMMGEPVSDNDDKIITFYDFINDFSYHLENARDGLTELKANIDKMRKLK